MTEEDIQTFGRDLLTFVREYTGEYICTYMYTHIHTQKVITVLVLSPCSTSLFSDIPVWVFVSPNAVQIRRYNTLKGFEVMER